MIIIITTITSTWAGPTPRCLPSTWTSTSRTARARCAAGRQVSGAALLGSRVEKVGLNYNICT